MSPRRTGLLAVFVVGATLSQIVPAPALAQRDEEALPPLQVVVLVDESGSLSEADVVREKEAARTIGASALAPGSVVSVVGFGSSNGPGQSAVHVACPPIEFDSPQKRDSLATCVGDLHRRTPQEGDGTDHVAALQQALDFVRTSGPDKKVVFLLTDGKLDVSDSPAWGDSPARRNGAAAAKVKDVLADLNDAGAQVWPLGFGEVDQAALRDFAIGKSCTPAAPDPHEQIVPSANDLQEVLQNAFSSASCVKYGPLDTGTVPEAGSVDLHVDIPAVASDASILVYKRDPRVQVEYFAPDESKPAPKAGGSHFEFAGQSTETESVRITDPEPGTWTIRLSSADVPAQEVAATVVYQAAVKAYLTISPPQPAAGQTVGVDMQVWARGKAVTDPQTLQGLSFVTTLTGADGLPPQQVALTDAENDGTFSGKVTVPKDASGDLTFTGQVSGIGIGGDTRVLSTKVQNGQAAVQAQILFDTNTATATPGGAVSGIVSVSNNSGQPVRLRLDVAEPAPGASVTVEPASMSAAAGVSSIPFTLRFGAGTVVGSNAATLRLVDQASPDVPVAERLFAIEVSPAPTFVERLFWLWVGLGAVLAAVLVFLLARLRSSRAAKKVRGLRVRLLRNDFAISELEPQDPASSVFGFVLHEEFTGLQLQPAGAGEPNVYEVRRAGSTLRLTLPDRGTVTTTSGERHDIGSDLAVVVVDERGVPTANMPVAGPVSDAPFNPFAGNVSALEQNGAEAVADDTFTAPPVALLTGPDPFDDGPGAFPPAAPPGDTGYDPNNPFR
jgi:hypothetical protein